MIAGALLASCTSGHTTRNGEWPRDEPNASVEVVAAPLDGAESPVNGDDADVGAREVVPPSPPERAPEASPRLTADASLTELVTPIQSYYAGRNATQVHVQTDKPLYRPGETIWIRSWHLNRRAWTEHTGGYRVDYQLISPKGAVVLHKMIRPQPSGLVTNDFEIPPGVPGGEYLIRVSDRSTGAKEERPVLISAFEAPRIKKTLEFVHKAYGPGDEVSATLELKRPTGEPLAHKALEGVVRLDGQTLPPVTIQTNAHGGALVRFELPAEIAAGDGLLTVMVEDGGVTESISRRVPIVLKKINLALYPEGGDLIEGLPGRVYFAATNTLGKPADVKGRLVDDQGHEVARLESVRDGRGRFAFTPARGRSYHVEITAPVGVEERVPVKGVKAKGCALRSYDDYDGQAEAIRVGVRCTAKRRVRVTAVQRDHLLDAALIEVSPGREAVAHLKSEDAALARAQGAARVTVWGEDKAPLAERLVYRNRRNGLRIAIEPDAEQYAPRDTVTLKVTTTDDSGAPVPASVALSVVDDTVLSYADDKTGHMLSALLLESELSGVVEEPNFYFDETEPKAAQGLDLLMGTLGWRRFAWAPVFNPPPRRVEQQKFYDFEDDMIEGALVRPDGMMLRAAEVDADAPMLGGAEIPLGAEEAGEVRQEAEDGAFGAADAVAPAPEPKMNMKMEEKKPAPMARRRDDDKWGGQVAWAPVRVFPIPERSEGLFDKRTDFRDTVYWAPGVKTDEDGVASVSFPLSDAVTSFRVLAEGVGGGALGRGEEALSSSLPFSMSVKLPLEVSAGDALKLPLTLTNASEEAHDVVVEARFGELLSFAGEPTVRVRLAPRSRASVFFPVTVTGERGASRVSFTAKAGAFDDAFERDVRVVAPGFPQEFSRSGQLQGRTRFEVDLGEVVSGSVSGQVTFYPSPVSTMVAGMEGMLRQPGGCFEQASSTNYPNLMVMRYLKEHNVEDPALWRRSGELLDQGYKLLTGYESPKKGYEWFGGDPGHEALTAYGLMEFVDMQGVWSGVDGSMVSRTAAWLKSRRDGEGGFKRNPRALDSFGQASKEVTDAYIVYALTEGGFGGDFPQEVEAQAKAAEAAQDPYRLALMTNSLLNVESTREQGRRVARRLAGMQDAEGVWLGADHSITRSGGQNLKIETTALATMALLKAGGHDDPVRRGVGWLNDNRGGFGQWGTTQATILALKAMTRYASSTKAARSSGEIEVLVNGARVRQVAYAEGHRDTIVIDGLEQLLKPGKNTVEIVHESQEEMPFSLAIASRSRVPGTSPEATIDLTTALEKDEVGMGEVVRLNATVINRTDQGQPMTLARVGLPGGLTFQLWQLKELREKGLIGFFETHPREVILYLRDMKPGERATIPLDLVATVPGQYEAPASSAYLYYTDEHKTWRPGLTARVTR